MSMRKFDQTLDGIRRLLQQVQAAEGIRLLDTKLSGGGGLNGDGPPIEDKIFKFTQILNERLMLLQAMKDAEKVSFSSYQPQLSKGASLYYHV